MDKLTKEDKLQIMRQVADIATSVSKSSSGLTWNVQSIDTLVHQLYRRMTHLIESDDSEQQGRP